MMKRHIVPIANANAVAVGIVCSSSSCCCAPFGSGICSIRREGQKGQREKRRSSLRFGNYEPHELEIRVNIYVEPCIQYEDKNYNICVIMYENV